MRVDGRILNPESNLESKKIVHNVYILDSSTSMHDFGKYSVACEGINTELKTLKEDKSVKYTQTIIEFSSSYSFMARTNFSMSHSNDHIANISTHYFMKPIEEIVSFRGRGANGGTPLFQTVGETIDRFISTVKGDERVLIKIFTDGEENTSSGKYKDPKVLHDLIQRAQNVNNFTIVFVGTDGDVRKMVSEIGLHASNTLRHNNTRSSVGSTFSKMTHDTMLYSVATAGGASAASLTRGFFKDTVPSTTENKVEVNKSKDKDKTNKQ